MANNVHGYVEYGRWWEADKAINARMDDAERKLEALGGAEQIHEAMSQRISVLEERYEHGRESEKGRRERVWVLVLGVMSGIVFPLVVGAVLTLFHLHGA